MFNVIFFIGYFTSITSVLPNNITVSHFTYRPYILTVADVEYTKQMKSEKESNKNQLHLRVT